MDTMRNSSHARDRSHCCAAPPFLCLFVYLFVVPLVIFLKLFPTSIPFKLNIFLSYTLHFSGIPNRAPFPFSKFVLSKSESGGRPANAERYWNGQENPPASEYKTGKNKGFSQPSNFRADPTRIRSGQALTWLGRIESHPPTSPGARYPLDLETMLCLNFFKARDKALS
jgi:hypothetical protein